MVKVLLLLLLWDIILYKSSRVLRANKEIKKSDLSIQDL